MRALRTRAGTPAAALNRPLSRSAGLDKVNPGSMILSGEMMLRHLQWHEAADLVIKGLEASIAAKTVTYDFERQMKLEGAKDVKLLKCSEFGQAIVDNM